MNKPEWTFIAIGCLACICNGGIQPAFGIILSKLTAVDIFSFNSNFHMKIFILIKKKVFQECDKQVQKDRVLLYILLFIGFGILMLISMFLEV